MWLRADWFGDGDLWWGGGILMNFPLMVPNSMKNETYFHLCLDALLMFVTTTCFEFVLQK